MAAEQEAARVAEVQASEPTLAPYAAAGASKSGGAQAGSAVGASLPLHALRNVFGNVGARSSTRFSLAVQFSQQPDPISHKLAYFSHSY